MTRAISQERNLEFEGIPKDEVRENFSGTPESKTDLAMMYGEQARYDDTKRLLLAAFHSREARLGPQHPHTIESSKQLVTLYESWGKPDEAEKWRAKLVQTGVTGQ